MVDTGMIRRLSRPFTAVAVVLLSVSCATGAPKTGGRATATPPPTETRPATATASPSPRPATPTESPAPTRRPSATASATERATPTRTPRPTRTPEEDVTPIVVERGTSGRREIALTFDAGADRGNAVEILDLLAAEGINVTFGMTGQWAEANPDLVERMVEEGHELINHSWSHPSFTGASTGGDPLPAADRRGELRTTERFVRDLTGYDMRPYFRPPYGDLDESVLADVAAVGYTVTVMWTCDSLGWDGASPDDIVARCGAEAAPGDIILMHLGSDSTDLQALPDLIESLADAGYAFVTVTELLEP